MLADKLKTLINEGSQPNILVIGDLMLDRYVWGTASRLSPEAPVPIVNVQKETATAGGAANVALNLVSLGAKVSLCGLTGDDAAGIELTDLLSAKNIDVKYIIKDAGRPTTIKTRYLSGNHQMLRVDRETDAPLSAALAQELTEKITHVIHQADVVLFSDYNKGLFTPPFTRELIKIASAAGKRVIVDPKGLDYAKYQGAFMIKPNRKELAEAAKMPAVHNLSSLHAAAKVIIGQTQAHYVVVTLAEEGMAVISSNDPILLPVKATEVFDVTGAGDTVLAAIACFISAGLNVAEACELANHAAAIVIKQVGNGVTTAAEILKHLTTE